MSQDHEVFQCHISRKWNKIQLYLQWETNRKSCNLLTLNDPWLADSKAWHCYVTLNISEMIQDRAIVTVPFILVLCKLWLIFNTVLQNVCLSCWNVTRGLTMKPHIYHIFSCCSRMFWMNGLWNFELYARIAWINNLLQFFCRVMLCISAAYAVIWCLSVCLSRSWVSKRIDMSKFFHRQVATPF